MSPRHSATASESFGRCGLRGGVRCPGREIAELQEVEVALSHHQPVPGAPAEDHRVGRPVGLQQPSQPGDPGVQQIHRVPGCAARPEEIDEFVLADRRTRAKGEPGQQGALRTRVDGHLDVSVPDLERAEDPDVQGFGCDRARSGGGPLRLGRGVQRPGSFATQLQGGGDGVDRVPLRASGPALLQVPDRPRTETGPTRELPLRHSGVLAKRPQHLTEVAGLPGAGRVLLLRSGHGQQLTDSE